MLLRQALGSRVSAGRRARLAIPCQLARAPRPLPCAVRDQPKVPRLRTLLLGLLRATHVAAFEPVYTVTPAADRWAAANALHGACFYHRFPWHWKRRATRTELSRPDMFSVSENVSGMALQRLPSPVLILVPAAPLNISGVSAFVPRRQGGRPAAAAAPAAPPPPSGCLFPARRPQSAARHR